MWPNINAPRGRAMYPTCTSKGSTQHAHIIMHACAVQSGKQCGGGVQGEAHPRLLLLVWATGTGAGCARLPK